MYFNCHSLLYFNPHVDAILFLFQIGCQLLNACAQSHQWKGVSWVFNQLRKSGLKPNGATYGLAMEVITWIATCLNT